MKDDLKRLIKYVADLRSRLEDPVPPKHAHREKQFREYLEKDIKSTQAKIEALMLNREKEK